MGCRQHLVIVQLTKFGEICKRQIPHNNLMGSHSGRVPCKRLERLGCSSMLISLRREKHCWNSLNSMILWLKLRNL